MSDTEALAGLGKIIAQQDTTLEKQAKTIKTLFNLLAELTYTLERGLVPTKDSEIMQQAKHILASGLEG